MNSLPAKYQEVIKRLKEKIQQARTKAVYSVNAQLLAIHWEIGNTILEQQAAEGWGTKVIDRLSHDLKAEFPDMKGLSVRNIKYMRAFAEAYRNFRLPSEKQLNSPEIQTSEIVQVPPAQLNINEENQIVQVNLAQLSWYHHVVPLFESVDCLIWTDTQGHRSDIEALNFLADNLKNQCRTFKVELQLKGFKKAGTKAFDIWKGIIIQLGNYSYTYELQGVAGILLEKLYHQETDKIELAFLTEKYCESLLDDINQRIEQITKTPSS